MTASATFLELDAVCKRYGDVIAVDGISLDLKRNEFITLLGPSGCGKTTILRMIAGFVQPTSGEIRRGGEVISSATRNVPPEKREFGMVFQSFAVWPHMTVGDNVALPLRLRKLDGAAAKARLKEVLSLCRLEGLADREPHQLSGGQLQRVALARALVYQPQLVLLDEPLSNLDIALREELRRELHQIHQATEATFVLVTHDQVEAMSLSDRVVVMKDGKIQQIGAPNEIYRNPRTDFVASFVGSANIVEGTVIDTGAAGAPAVPAVRVRGLTIRVPKCRDIQIGARVKLAIHPEAIRLGEGSAALQGRIKSVFFLGRTEEIAIDVHGVQLRVTELRGRSFVAGDTVPVAISEDSIVLLEAGSSG